MARTVITASLLTLAALSSVARADEGTPEPRSPEGATMIAVSGTLAGILVAAEVGDMKTNEWRTAIPLFALAEVLPSAGKIYAGDYLSPGLVTRVAGGSLIVLALADPFERTGDEWFSSEARAAAAIGVLATLGGTVYDIATSARSAREYNADHGHHVQVVPTFDPSTNQVGMAIGGVL